MDFDVESTIQDNMRLKKALQMSRFSMDKLQKQHKELNQMYSECISHNKSLKQDFCQLQRKYQQSYTDSIKDSNSLISQIQELKQLVEDKQRQMEQLQIKLIPNLDQDMLRVKLINEMQGPYQDTVDKKDNQIQKLKNKITQLQRNLQINSLSLKGQVRQLKKQRDELKHRFQEQTNRLMQQLTISLSRNQSQSIESSIIKKQRKQIQELKVTLQFIQTSQEKYLREISGLKQQRQELLQKLMQSTGKQALLLQSKHSTSDLQKLKQEKLKLAKQSQKLKAQNDKFSRQVRKLQQEKNKLQSQYQKQLNQERYKAQNQKNQLNSLIMNLKDQLRRLSNFRIQSQTDRGMNNQRVRILEKQIYQKNREIQTLRMSNSRFTQVQPSCWDPFSKGTKPKAQDKKQNDQTIINRKNITQNKGQINELKKQNQKLKKKLSEANSKILELLRQKLKTNKNISPQRDRTVSNIQKPMGVFLEYEDCGFTPLVQPTLYTYKQTRK